MRLLASTALSHAMIASALPCFAAAPSGEWTARHPVPVGVSEVGVAALDGQVYAVGGTEQEGKNPPNWASSLNLAYDPVHDAWRRRAPLPSPLTHVGVAAMGGKLYAIGGFTGIVHMGARDLAFAYDPKADRWSSLPPISGPRGSVAVAAIDGKLHVFGGRTSTNVVRIPSPPGAPAMFAAFGTVNTHEVYDPATGRWSRGAPIPGPARDHMGVVVLGGQVHLFGGRVADVSDNLDRHDVYDPGTDSWTTAAPLPRPRSSGAYAALHGLIIYAGGECKPGGQPFTPNAYDDVTAYSSKTDAWSNLTPLPTARHAFGAASVGDVAYFVGGAPVCGGGTMTDMLALTLPKVR